VFTGLIQSLGTYQHIGEDALKISCAPETADLILQDLAIGDSVAVDGACLTVETILSQGFVASISPETIQRTTFGAPAEERWVNLETSLRVGSKLGGHFVTGHVDGLGQLEAAVQTARSWELSFRTHSSAIARYVLPKGSIAVNGVSLTIAECDRAGSWFKVAVIPHTYAETNLRYLTPGSWVNLEGDILGKYVEKFLRSRFSGEDASEGDRPEAPWADLTPEFLAEHGYL